MLRSVAILFHPHRDAAIAEARWLDAELSARRVQTTLGSGWDPDVAPKLCCGRDLVVAFGGDGTIIRIARLASEFGVPVLGVNLGRVGFLADLTPERLRGAVDALVDQAFWLEARTMLEVMAEIGGNRHHFLSLNEVALARGVAPRAIHVNTHLDGEEFMRYTADGVLVATATGSTAYSLAAGGPILYPESTDYMVTPVAPHLHIGRSLILPATTTVRLTLSSDRPAVLSVDGGEEHALGSGDAVEVRRAERIACFAHLSSRDYFYRALAARLQ